jgi:hypothetical protein
MKKVYINKEINKKYGRLIILKELPHKVYSNGATVRFVECKCECGNIKKISLQKVLTGYTKSCGCLMMETVSKSHRPEYENGKLYCSTCKKYKSPMDFYNDHNNTKRFYKRHDCKPCHKKYKKGQRKIRQSILEGYLTRSMEGIRTRCRKRKEDFNIDLQYLIGLYNKKCGLCALSGTIMTHVLFKGRCKTNIGVDRIDPLLGYMKGNIQLVCTLVNTMKLDLQVEEFIYWCSKIINNQKNNLL